MYFCSNFNDMKRYIFFLASVALLFSCSNSADFETDYKVYEVQGKVREVTYKNNENPDKNVVIQFNKDGMLVHEQLPGRIFEYKYDGKYIKELKSFIGDSVDLRRTYKYEKHYPVEIREFNNEGTIRKKVQYTYDSDGNRTKGVILNPYNDTLFVWDYTFKDGLVYEENRIGFSEVIPTGDTQNSEPIVKTYKKSYEARFEYAYNDKKELASIIEFAGDERILKTDYKVFHGVPLQIAVINYWGGAVSDSTTMTYGFDDKGNWIFKRTLSSRGREQRQERVVKYYKE